MQQQQALASLLRQCIASRGPLADAQRVHQVVASSSGLSSDTFLGNLVVQLYGVCGSPRDASEAFDAIPKRNSFSWNILLRSHTQNGHIDDSRYVFGKMPQRDAVSWTLMVTLLGRIGSVAQARLLFDRMPQPNVVTRNALVAAYAQNGDVGEACRVFRSMPERDIVSWITLLGSCASAGLPAQARQVFDRMPVRCDYVAVAMLQTYANSGCLRDGRMLFENLQPEQQSNAAICCAMMVCHAKSGQVDQTWSMFVSMDVRNRVSWNVMLAAFGSSSRVEKAREVFTKMPQRDIVAWNSMLHAFACSGLPDDAKSLFDQMPAIRDVVSWATLAKVYRCVDVLEKMPERNTVAWNSLLAAYSKQGEVSNALSMFWVMQQKDVVSWNTMLQCLLQAGDDVTRFFNAVPAWDEVSSTMMIQWYANNRDIDNAVLVFEQVPVNMMVPWSAMVTAYSQNGSLVQAKELFDRMPVKSTVAWNSMIAGYAQQGYAQDAVVVFGLMDLEGAKVDVVSFVSALDACSKMNCLWLGRLLVQESRVVVQEDTILATSVVNMYGKCGSVGDARTAFAQATIRDEVLWSALIAAYAQNGRGDEALHTFKFMDLEGWQPDEVTLTSVVDACVGSASFPDPALWVCLLECSGSVKLCNAVLNLFGKCGHVDQTRTMFDRMVVRDAVTWTTLVTMYAQNGLADESVNAFREMEHDGLRPEGVTMVSLLSACSHAGMAELCRGYLVSLTIDYGLRPSLEHYECVVDSLCRVGELGMAYELISTMPYVPTSVPWLAMLSMCKTYGDKQYALLAAQEALRLDPAASLHYVLWLTTQDTYTHQSVIY